MPKGTRRRRTDAQLVLGAKELGPQGKIGPHHLGRLPAGVIDGHAELKCTEFVGRDSHQQPRRGAQKPGISIPVTPSAMIDSRIGSFLEGGADDSPA